MRTLQNLRSLHPFAFVAIVVSGLLLSAGRVEAGRVFLTGHDPDFHAQDSLGAGNLLRAGLNYVTNGTYNVAGNKFLWVESRISPPGGFRVGEFGLNAVGLALGVNYDRANAAELVGANFSLYTAIVIASDFGGLLGKAELDGLIARKTDIQNFINAGGGLFAMAESNHLAAGSTPYGYLPTVVSSVAPSGPFTVTPFGAGAPFFLTNGDVNDPTHNSFGLIGGLTAVDLDAAQRATTLAGDVFVTPGGFVPGVPEPSTLVGAGFAALVGFAVVRRRRLQK